MKKTVILLLATILCFSLVGCGNNEKHEGEAKTPSGSSIMKGKNFQDVVNEFESQGFSNIKTEKLGDLITGWLTKDGEVEEVSVGGDTGYSSDKWVPADTAVIIKYHTFPERDEQQDSQIYNDSGSKDNITDENSITNTPINENGQIYEINQIINFDFSSLEIKRIKIVKDAYYIFMMEYVVTNKANSELIWKFHYDGNICGKFESPSYYNLPDYKKDLGGNTAYIYDDDIGSNHHLDGHLQANEQITASANFLLDTGIGYGEVTLLENEPMTLLLNYMENEKKFTYEIKIN